MTSRWLGRCPECGTWNSLTEEAVPQVRPAVGASGSRNTVSAPVGPVATIGGDSEQRISSGLHEMDRVLGGGIVPGSLVLIGGDPGIGKSTLLTQIAHRVAEASPSPTLYVTGEESPRQVRLRCERLGTLAQGLLVAGATDLGTILHHIQSCRPVLAVVDSIQTTYDGTLETAPGTVSQLRQTAHALAGVARELGTAVFLIGHVTKEGVLAGPRVLEHMVDTVLYFEGDRHQSYRVLRAVKNRFGPTDELGLFEMHDDGLHEVENASAALLAERRPDFSGSAVTATLEGTRPLLVEVQALVTRSFLTSPRRVVNGFDYNRANMIMAVLEKRMGLRLGEQDVFLNVAGGVRVIEPAADLAVALAIASSYRDTPLPADAVVVGEVGLGGEVRSVVHIERRLREAQRQGFSRALVPKSSRVAGRDGMGTVRVATVKDAIDTALIRPGEDGQCEQ